MPASSPSAAPEEETIVPTFETQKLARTFMLDIPAPRGQITDRNGVPMAQNRLSYNLAITFPTPLNFSDAQALSYTREKIEEAGKLIGRMFRISDQAILRHYRNRGIMPFEIAPNLTPQEYEGIKDKLPPEMMVRPVYVRIYPNGKVAGQIVGYTGKTGRNPDGIVDNHETIWPQTEGREGLEQTFNEMLTGKNGEYKLTFDKSGRKTSEKLVTPPEPGYNVVTTLKKVHEVPHKPGVYLMRDRFNRVIYVGKARDLRKRVSSYFLPSKLAQADLKTRALLDATWDFETHTVRSEAESVLLEGKLIKEYRPRYNISFRDDKRFLVVRVDLSEEWPRFRLARFKKDDGSRYFGPYAHAGALRQTLNFMRKRFGVLTFGRGAPTERELKSSTYQVPVRLSETSAEQYRERVAQACEFLEGRSREMIAALEEQMHIAAEKMDFEKAAELRNMVADLRNTTRPTRRFTRGSLPSIIDPTADVQALGDALHLPDPYLE